MLREIATRVLLAPWVILAGLVLGLWSAAVVVFGARRQRMEVGRAQSRWLNACMDGSGAVTFSAASWACFRAGKPLGRARVELVNRLNGDPDHAADAYAWHASHMLADEMPRPL